MALCCVVVWCSGGGGGRGVCAKTKRGGDSAVGRRLVFSFY
jgi:hypothetical protein